MSNSRELLISRERSVESETQRNHSCESHKSLLLTLSIILVSVIEVIVITILTYSLKVVSKVL